MKFKDKQVADDMTAAQMSSINYPEDIHDMKSLKSNIHPPDPHQKLDALKLKVDTSYYEGF